MPHRLLHFLIVFEVILTGASQDLLTLLGFPNRLSPQNWLYGGGSYFSNNFNNKYDYGHLDQSTRRMESAPLLDSSQFITLDNNENANGDAATNAMNQQTLENSSPSNSSKDTVSFPLLLKSDKIEIQAKDPIEYIKQKRFYEKLKEALFDILNL